MDNILSNGISKYFRTLTYTGTINPKESKRLLLLSFLREYIEGLTEMDNRIYQVFECLYKGSCVINERLGCITINTISEPDYYIGFCDNPSVFRSLNDLTIFKNTISGKVTDKPIYPTSSTYVYFNGNKKLIYLIYNSKYDVLTDVDNANISFDLTDQTLDQINVLPHADINKDGQIYKVIGTWDNSNDYKNGYRFKFNKN